MGFVIAAAGLRAFHQGLLKWYYTHGRHDLPWRNTQDAYAIYISEIMLQQTQVETVRTRYYGPFLKRFPTISALAKAPHEEVLSSWQGLGYYRRAGYLHDAAKRCLHALPQTVEELVALPGIGRNTAHAILAFAHHKPYPVMEANVKRVLSRVLALKTPTEPDLWDKAEALLDRAHPFDYNQAMMDLGSMICTPRAPRCGECPAAIICKGKIAPLEYPAARKTKSVPVRKRTIIISIDPDKKIHATRRTTKFLQGMYHFNEQQEKAPRGAVLLDSIRQVYSHFVLEAQVYMVHQRKKHLRDAYTLAELENLPMSMAEKKILKLLAQSLIKLH